MAVTKNVAIITLSTRTPRVGPSVSAYLKGVFESESQLSNIKVSIVDLADFKLPVFNEAVVPAMKSDENPFVHEASKAWSAEIAKYDGYIFVTPEYNYGMPGGAKNAIDFLYHEISTKPAIVAGYGIFGAQKATTHLNDSLTGMKLRVASTLIQLPYENNAAGPDLMSAMLKGSLGEGSQKAWSNNLKPDILKAFNELKEALETPP